MTVEELLNLVRISKWKYYIIPKNKVECEKIQNFLLNNGFEWRGGEHWISVDNIKKFRLMYDHGYKLVYSSTESIINIYTDKKIEWDWIITDIFKKQNKDFIDDLFKDII